MRRKSFSIGFFQGKDKDYSRSSLLNPVSERKLSAHGYPEGVILPEYRLKDDAVFWESGAAVDQETAEASKMLKEILARRP